MPETSARLALPYLSESQASQEITHNKALIYIDALLHLATASITSPLTSEPGSPADGDTYLTGASCTGAFSGHDHSIAHYKQGWYFFTPIEGMRAYSKDDDLLYVFDGSTWNAIAGGPSGSFTASGFTFTVTNGRISAIV